MVRTEDALRDMIFDNVNINLDRMMGSLGYGPDMITARHLGDHISKEENSMLNNRVEKQLQEELNEKRAYLEEQARLGDRTTFIQDMASFRDELIANGFTTEQAWEVVSHAAKHRLLLAENYFLK